MAPAQSAVAGQRGPQSRSAVAEQRSRESLPGRISMFEARACAVRGAVAVINYSTHGDLDNWPFESTLGCSRGNGGPAQAWPTGGLWLSDN